MFVAITDTEWFEQLSREQPDEVNFWKPGGQATFKVLLPGEPLLFKLHSPHDYIVGGGFFVSFSQLPVSLAWEAFGRKNGVENRSHFRDRIWKYRRSPVQEADPTIGCIVLTSPFFWSRDMWFRVPENWPKSAVQGKGYTTAKAEGSAIWQQVQARLAAHTMAPAFIAAETAERYGSEFLTRGRLGQGAFRVLVTDAYDRRCAITGEKTLPALEAAHIKAFDELRPNRTDNGLLLRADMHKLFDRGLVTVTPELHVKVSPRIREEYQNGREYYRFDNAPLTVLPNRTAELPNPEFLKWHNEARFRG